MGSLAAAAETQGISQTTGMVILRPTRKLRALLPRAENVPPCNDTALGDWYVNRIVVDRQPLLLLVSSIALLPMLLPARDVRGLPARLGALVAGRLRRCGIDAHTIDAEQQAMRPVVIGPTVDRSVLGIMVDFAKSLPYHLQPGQWNEATLELVEGRLAETPCHATRSGDRVIFPEKKAPDLLRSKWLANRPLQPTSGGPIRVM
jgi:uncharacterized protein DUF6933